MPGILHGEHFIDSPGIPTALEPLLLKEAQWVYAGARSGHVIQQCYPDQHYTAWICDLQLTQPAEFQVNMDESCRAMLMVISGTASIYANEQSLPLLERHYYLLPPYHQARRLQALPGYFRMVVLLFNPVLTSLLGNVTDHAGQVQQGILMDGSRRQLQRILKNEEMGEIWQFKRQVLFLDLLLGSLEAINHASKLTGHLIPHRDFEKLEQVRQYIRSNMGKKLSVQMLAARFHILPAQLRHSYKQIYKHHLAEFIRTERLSRAKALLVQTEMPIHAIAWEVGYESAASFTRTFSMQFHQSPTDYRRMRKHSS